MTEAIEKNPEIVAVEAAPEKAEPEKAYTFRPLCGIDMFIMMKILSKVGINEVVACLENETILQLMNQLSGKGGNTDKLTIAGIAASLEIVNVILGNLPKCECEIMQMLSQCSNLSVDEVRALGFAEFTEMVMDFVRKAEFVDFIKVVSKPFR